MKYIVQPMGGNPHCRMGFDSMKEAIEALNNPPQPLCYGCKPYVIDIFTEEGGVRAYLDENCQIKHYVFSNIEGGKFNCKLEDKWVTSYIYKLATYRIKVANIAQFLED